jgi:hypothetical protein
MSCSIDALQERLKAWLKAPYFTIDEYAELLAGILLDYTTDAAIIDQVTNTCHDCHVAAAERSLEQFCRLHDIDSVEAGLEQVGPEPVFISRPTGDGDWFAVQLYSRYPRSAIPTGRLQ